MSHSPNVSGDSHSGGGRFEQTQWTVILKACKSGEPGSQEAMEEFAKIYWPPLYRFIRMKGHGVHDAQDLTQGFYGHFLKKRLLERITVRQGKFRSFLLTCLKNYLNDEKDRADAGKRRPSNGFVSLNAMEEEEGDCPAQSDGLTADQAYDKRWAEALLVRAQARLRDQYARRGKLKEYEVLNTVQFGRTGNANYVKLGEALGISEQAVKNAVFTMRQAYSDCIRAEVRMTIDESGKPRADVEKEIDEEIRHLIEAIGL